MLRNFIKLPFGILFLVFFLSACGEKAIISVPTETEAVEILVILQENGVSNVDKRFVGNDQKKEYEIFVSEGILGGESYNESLRILRAFCLPYEKPDEIQTKGLVDASETLKEKSKRQRKIEIIQQLRKTVPGITCIDLTFNSPQSPLERLNPSPATASVSLQYKDSPPSFTNEQIRDLVSKSVPDLKIENVQVYSYYVPVNKKLSDVEENSNSIIHNSQLKIFILIGVAFLLIFIVMTFIVILRRKKSDAKDEDDEYEEEEIPLLESGDEFEDE